jgi:hypothetical protein
MKLSKTFLHLKQLFLLLLNRCGNFLTSQTRRCPLDIFGGLFMVTFRATILQLWRFLPSREEIFFQSKEAQRYRSRIGLNLGRLDATSYVARRTWSLLGRTSSPACFIWICIGLKSPRRHLEDAEVLSISREFSSQKHSLLLIRYSKRTSPLAREGFGLCRIHPVAPTECH